MRKSWPQFRLSFSCSNGVTGYTDEITAVGVPLYLEKSAVLRALFLAVFERVGQKRLEAKTSL
jgi:hypothetical protein